MRRREVSQWNKEEMSRLMITGEALEIQVREIGLPVATHQFTSPGDLSMEEMYCAVVAFFSAMGDVKIGSTYLLVQ